VADWPDVDAVKRRLGITRNDAELNADVQLATAAAIEAVQADCAAWLAGTFPSADADDPPTPRDPDARLASAALLLAVSTYKAPDAPYGVAGVFDTAAIAVRDQHPQYGELLRGHRHDFGIG
jgi:hypothetical protein